MGKMQEEIKALRRQNIHLQNVVQRQRQSLADAYGAIQDYRKAITAHYVACAITFGEKREDCDTVWGWHLEVPADLVSEALDIHRRETRRTGRSAKRPVYGAGSHRERNASGGQTKWTDR